jgi:hypothetical protein
MGARAGVELEGGGQAPARAPVSMAPHFHPQNYHFSVWNSSSSGDNTYFTRMVPNDPCLRYGVKVASSPGLPLPPCIPGEQEGRLDARLEGSSSVPHPMNTWGRVCSAPVPPLMETGSCKHGPADELIPSFVLSSSTYLCKSLQIINSSYGLCLLTDMLSIHCQLKRSCCSAILCNNRVPSLTKP